MQKKLSNLAVNDGDGIISYKPGWFSKWVFPLFIGIVILTTTTLWLIHHPDMIVSRGIITGIDSSRKIISLEVQIPQKSLHKIALGQPSKIKFDDYPADSCGFVTGNLQYLTGARDDYLFVRLQLHNGLTTNQNKFIPYRKGLKVSMLIIIKDLRLLQRIFYKSKM
jgi:hypothetical protein